MLKEWDARREIVIPGDTEATLAFAVENWVHSATRAIQQHGRFAVALSGGSTPKAIYKQLANKPIDWSKVFLFWSDERDVPPDHPDSNYKMAMDSGGFSRVPPAQIFRMKEAEGYEDTIKRVVGPRLFDLVMLGVGEDGHTASLFPKTEAINENNKLVVKNHVPEKNTWRLTFTFPCINQSERAVIYAIGESKQSIVPLVLEAAIKSSFPASSVGTPERKALWILDTAAARLLSCN